MVWTSSIRQFLPDRFRKGKIGGKLIFRQGFTAVKEAKFTANALAGNAALNPHEIRGVRITEGNAERELMSTLPDVLPQIKMTGVYGFLLLKKITGLLIKGFHMYLLLIDDLEKNIPVIVQYYNTILSKTIQ